MIERLMDNPYAWLLLSLCTVISLIFAVYTWIAGRKTKEISIDSYTNEIVKKGKSPISKLDLKFDGKAIQDLSSTIFFLWNSGNDVINHSDMVGEKSVRIACEGEQFLDVQIIKQSDENNAFKISDVNSNNIGMKFDYIDIGEGVKIQVLHTGSREGIHIEYKIKGGKAIRDCATLRGNHGFKGFVKGIIDELIPMVLLIVGMSMSVLLCNAMGASSQFYEIVIFILTLLFSIILVVVYVKIKKKVRKMFHRTIPDSLKEE